MLVNIRERENVFKALYDENPDCDLAKLPKYQYNLLSLTGQQFTQGTQAPLC